MCGSVAMWKGEDGGGCDVRMKLLMCIARVDEGASCTKGKSAIDGIVGTWH